MKLKSQFTSKKKLSLLFKVYNDNILLIARMHLAIVFSKLQQQCFGHCRDNTVCNQLTGECDGSCAAESRGLPLLNSPNSFRLNSLLL